MNVAMCQFPITHDKEVNHHTARDYIDRAVTAASNDNDKKLDLIVLPEIWNSPYATAAFPDYAEHIPDMPDVDAATVIDPILSPSAYLLQQKAIQHGIYVVGGSIPEKVSSTSTEGENLCYNTCLVFSPQGNIITKHRKMHLFDINVPNGIQFKESDTLQPGHTISYFKYRNMVNIGIGICYDIRFPEYAMLLCQQYDCHVLIYPGAFNLVTGPAHWELLQRARALDNQCYVITASPARTVEAVEVERIPKYPHYTAWGHSTVVGPWGDVLATCEEGAIIVTAQIDFSKIPTIRQSIPISYQKRHDIYELKHPIVEI